MKKGNRVEEAVDDGEELQPLTAHPLLRRFHRSTVIRWALAGRLPATRVGRSWLSTDRLVREFVFPANEPPPVISVDERHQAAMRRIAAAKGGSRISSN